MGKEKGGFLTPKAIANRIKAKGLQKLRWYCQMCQKQCRDEAIISAHTMDQVYWSGLPGLPKKLKWPVKIVQWLDSENVIVYSNSDNAYIKDYMKRTTGISQLDSAMRANMSPLEVKLLETQDVMEVRGKYGRGVPVVVPQDIREVLSYLVNADVREQVGVLSTNKYLFPNRSIGVIRAYDSLKIMCQEVTLQKPEKLTSVNLRKYTATISQVFDLNSQQQQWLANHLGHSMDIHRIHYRQTSGLIERIDMAKLMLMQEYNITAKYAGRKLQDIQLPELVFGGESADTVQMIDENLDGVSLDQIEDDDEGFQPNLLKDDNFDEYNFDDDDVPQKTTRKKGDTSTRVKWNNEEIAENGFKCHMMSESHQRQLLLFAENPDEYIDTFSNDFKDGYLELLSRRFGTKRVHCNIVYQEYISERDHIHMNSTQWETLTDFVKWLGREGFCEVDNTEKGWFVKYIDRDPETVRKQEQIRAKERMDMDDNERMAKLIQEQIERGAKTEKNLKETEYTELQRTDEDEKVVVSLGPSKSNETTKVLPVDNPFKKPSAKADKDSVSETPGPSKSDSKTSKAGEKRKSALDEIMEFEEKKKEKMNRKDYWLHKDIVVKVVSKKLGDKYYKQKAYVKDVEDLYKGIIRMLDSGDKLKVDQSHLETVIPAIGKTVMIVNGAYRGQLARLESISQEKFSCTVSLISGPLKGRNLPNIPYEDISKLYQPS